MDNRNIAWEELTKGDCNISVEGNKDIPARFGTTTQDSIATNMLFSQSKRQQDH